jgi:hypothetical protein
LVPSPAPGFIATERRKVDMWSRLSPPLEVFATVDLVPLHKRYDPASDLTLIDPVIQ